MKKLLINLLRFYRFFISPFLGSRCRFIPSCSQYGIEAVGRFGAFKGAWLIINRLCRCHPWGGYGYNAVPEQFRWFENKHKAQEE